MRIALGIEYDGSRFFGWQAQRHAVRTVQEELQKALSKVANHSIEVVCAGRTDAGVHGTGQVVHFDSEAERTDRAWVYGGNANLPKDICIRWAKRVPEEFHARFSALRRAYRYVILNRDIRSAVLADRVSLEYRKLDAARMAEAAGYLLGEHDFSSYRAVACQAHSPVRTVYRLDVKRAGDIVAIDAEANGFLHHMVRNIAGVLIAIGAGEREPVWAREVLEARDRTAGGVTGLPHGLYLVGVDYPPSFEIPRLPPPSIVW